MYPIITYAVLLLFMTAWQIVNVAPFFKLYRFQKEVGYEKNIKKIKKPFKMQENVFYFERTARGLTFVFGLVGSTMTLYAFDFQGVSGWKLGFLWIMGFFILYFFFKNIVTSPHIYKHSFLMEDLFNGYHARAMDFNSHSPHHEKYQELSQIELKDILKEDLQEIHALNEYGLQCVKLTEKLMYKYDMLKNSVGLSKDELDKLNESYSLTSNQLSQVEKEMWDTTKVLYFKFFKTEQELLEEEEETEVELEEEHEETIQTIHIGEKEFENEWVVRIFASCANSKDVFVHHIGGFKENETKELNELLQVSRQMLYTDKDYEDIKHFEYWFAPSSLFESDWEGISPTVKRLAQDWSLDPSAPPGTPTQITKIETVQYGQKGNVIQVDNVA